MLSPVAHWAFDDERGQTARDRSSGAADPIHYVFNEARYKPASDPLWRKGVCGGALLFDGYSTWISRAAEHTPRFDRVLTIEAWVAPRSYEGGEDGRLTAIVSQHDRDRAQGYILGLYTSGQWSLQLALNGQWTEIWSRERRLPCHQWSHIAAVYDGERGELRLYLNGEAAALEPIPAGQAMTPCPADLLIGRSSQPAKVFYSSFELNRFDGLIDELKLYDGALDSDDVRQVYQAYLRDLNGVVPEADSRPNRARFAGDRHRPQYHFMPPEHWMNEPHAPLHFRDKYHLTYQSNPRGPYWYHIHWGHAVSDDLVHWHDLPDAIVPEAGSVAPSGIWSGSAAVDDSGNPAYFFAAGDFSQQPNQRTGLARSIYLEDGDVNLRRWVTHPTPITVQQPDLDVGGGKVRYGEFRDPFVWKEGDTWYQLVASGVENAGGTALVYTSPDLLNWTYRGPILIGDDQKYPQTGQVWELPVLLPLGQGKHVFVISPWFDGYSPHLVRYVFYWLGRWNAQACRFVPDHDEPRLFDYGQHFTGPSGMIDGQGRALLFSIAQDRRTDRQHYDSGWAHNAGLPIVLSLRDDGQLGIEPIPELESLRGAHLLSARDESLPVVNSRLAGVTGDMLEIMLELESVTAKKYGIRVRQTPDGAEETVFYYHTGQRTLYVNREQSSLSPEVVEKGVQGGPLDLNGEPLRLRLYLDKSMIEAYANGLKSITTRVYPSRSDAIGLQLWSDGEVQVKALDVWEMQPAYGG